MPAIGIAISGLVTAFKATAIGSFLTTHWLGRLLASTALTALQAALTPRPPTPGIATEYTLTGDTNPCGFVLGTYATAGDMVCPPMSHGEVGGTPNAFLTYVIALSDVPGQALLRLIIDGAYVTRGGVAHAEYGQPLEGRLAGRAWVKYYDGSQTAADPMLLAKYGSYPERPWTADMIGRNVCYAILTFQYDRERFTGLPVCRFEMAGIPLYDPRLDSTVGGAGAHRWANRTTWTASGNPMVQTYNLLRGVEIPGLGTYGGQVEAADLPLDVWFTAMNACDVTAPGSLPLFGGMPTWAAGIEVRVDREPASIIEELLKAATAQMTDNAGVWKPRVGPPGLPVLFITDDDQIVTRPQDRDPFPPADQRYNGVAASYPEPSALWEVKTAPPRYNPAWEIEDGGRRVASLQLPAVPVGGQVQRIMEALARDERRHLRHGFSLPPMAAILEPLDTISWTSAWRGYTGKLFEVGEVADDLKTMLQQVAVRECDPADWVWNTSFEKPIAIPSAVTVYPASVTVPGFDLLAHSIADGAGTPRRAALRPVWTASGMTGFRGLEYEVRVQATGTIIARNSITDTGPGETILSEGILGGIAYQARSRPIADRPVAWTDWKSATTSDVRIGMVDLATPVLAAINDTAALAASTRRTLEVTNKGEAIFYDTFDGDLSNWQSYYGTGEVTAVTSSEGVGGKIMRIGNNAGNDTAWLIHKHLIPFDPSMAYKTTIRIRSTAGGGGAYIGFAGVAADGVTLVNVEGVSTATGSQHYHVMLGSAPAAVFTDYTGYTLGRAATGGYLGTISTPSPVHTNVAYLRPLIVVNYGVAGITDIASFKVENAITANMSARVQTVEAASVTQGAAQAMVRQVVTASFARKGGMSMLSSDFTVNVAGAPSTSPPLPTDATYGPRAANQTSTDPQSTGLDLVVSGYVPLYSVATHRVDPARKYRIRMRVKRDAFVSGSALLYAGYCALDDVFATVGSNGGHRYSVAVAENMTTLPVGQWTEFLSSITTGASGDGSPTIFPAGTTQIRLMSLVNYYDATAGNVTRISTLELIDVTEGEQLAATTAQAGATASAFANHQGYVGQYAIGASVPGGGASIELTAKSLADGSAASTQIVLKSNKFRFEGDLAEFLGTVKVGGDLIVDGAKSRKVVSRQNSASVSASVAATAVALSNEMTVDFAPYAPVGAPNNPIQLSMACTIRIAAGSGPGKLVVFLQEKSGATWPTSHDLSLSRMEFLLASGDTSFRTTANFSIDTGGNITTGTSKTYRFAAYRVVNATYLATQIDLADIICSIEQANL